jgi:LmbE family N-acetylglucosaminyl deacetylase/glycosyltransferase involved in cell wall biosynthesis
METEDRLIPYHTTDLTGKKVLVLAPHPDDETIGCGGALALHTKAGDPVKVVFLTNGARGDSSGKARKARYVALRQQEAVEACAFLGVTDTAFWPYEDRALAGSRGALRRLIDLIRDFAPELVYAPSPLEFHPDHRAACVLLCDAISSCGADFQVAFYEVGQPLRANLLVDTTPVLDQKERAVKAYRSQLGERPYEDFTMALNRYRSLTLPMDVICAEAFSVWDSETIRKVGPFSLPLQHMERLLPGPGEAGSLVSVIVRTKDRPALLANALTCIAAQTYANIEIVLVNDGGEDVKDVALSLAGGIPVTYIAHEKTQGRAAAANAGMKAARGLYLNFLDDDDVFYANHIETLTRRLQSDGGHIAYGTVVSAYFYGSPEYPQHCIRRVVNHDVDFDPDRLLFQNYIPIMAVLFHREVPQKVGGFDEGLDLFEDWDFWIRASRRYQFHHVDKATAEYRFYGSDTTEASHREKYDYVQAQAEIFDRISPLLTGKIWTRLVDSDYLYELGPSKGHGRPGNRQLDLEKALWEANQELERMKTRVAELQTANETSQRRIQEMLTSRGWRWLNRFGRIKRKVNGEYLSHMRKIIGRNHR